MTRRRDGRCGRCRATRRRLPSSRRRGRGRSGSLPRAGGWSGRWSSQVALLLVAAGLPPAARVVVGAAGFGGGGLAGDEDPVVVFGPVAAAQVAGDHVGAGHLASSARTAGARPVPRAPPPAPGVLLRGGPGAGVRVPTLVLLDEGAADLAGVLGACVGL